MAQRQSLAQSESKLTRLEFALADVRGQLNDTRVSSAKKITGLSQQLAQIKTTEEKDGHKLTAMHKVVEGKDALINQINAANAKFEDDLAASAVHLKEIESAAAKSRQDVAAVSWQLESSEKELKHLQAEQKKSQQVQRQRNLQSFAQAETTLQAKSKAEAHIRDLEQTLAVATKEHAAQV